MNLQKLLLTRRFFSTLAFFSMQTVFFIYLQGKGLSNSEIAFSLSLLFFCNQALAILAGIWGDRFGLAKMMLLGCFLDVIAYIFFLSADNYILLLIATTCFGLVPMRKPAYWCSRVKNTKRKPDYRENIWKSLPCRPCLRLCWWFHLSNIIILNGWFGSALQWKRFSLP